MSKRILGSMVVGICAVLLAVPAASAQPSGQSGQSSSQSGGGAGGSQTSAPSGGLSGGTAPIETTLFAYRSLQSNAEAIAAKVFDTGLQDRLVIGSQADISGFLQWRTVLGQTDFLKTQLDAMHSELAYLNSSYSRAIPLASLSVSKTHRGSFAKGGSGSYTIIVSNSAAASVTTGPVIVSDTPPDGMTVSSMSGRGWTCNPPTDSAAPNTCMRTDPLGPGAVYDPITVTVNVGAGVPDAITNTATVSGGGSATASASDPTALTASGRVTGAGRGGERALFIAPLEATASGGAGGGTGSTAAAAPFSTALSAIPTLTSLAQFIATSFAVNETLSPWQGTMTDLPLINAVAGVLRQHGRTVFVPSTYPPLTMTGNDLRGTYFLRKLIALRDARVVLWRDIESANALLMDANFVIQNPTKYAAADVNNGLEYAGKAQSLLTSAQTLGAGVDSFIASLFGGQVPAPAAGSASSSGSGAPGASGGGSSGASSSAAGSSGTPSPFSTTTATASNPAAGGQNSGSGGAASSQTSVSLQQILASDFLAQRIFSSKPDVAPSDIDTVNFLTVHALESGGSELVKSNIFYGTRIFFSGGSTATFSLYRLQGDLRCAGTALNYIGNVREKSVEHRLMEEDIRHDAKVTGFYCADAQSSAKVSEGMTKDEVRGTLGSPDRTSQKGNIYVYTSRNLTVEFKHGVVKRINAGRAAQGSDEAQAAFSANSSR